MNTAIPQTVGELISHHLCDAFDEIQPYVNGANAFMKPSVLLEAIVVANKIVECVAELEYSDFGALPNSRLKRTSKGKVPRSQKRVGRGKK